MLGDRAVHGHQELACQKGPRHQRLSHFFLSEYFEGMCFLHSFQKSGQARILIYKKMRSEQLGNFREEQLLMMVAGGISFQIYGTPAAAYQRAARLFPNSGKRSPIVVNINLVHDRSTLIQLMYTQMMGRYELNFETSIGSFRFLLSRIQRQVDAIEGPQCGKRYLQQIVQNKYFIFKDWPELEVNWQNLYEQIKYFLGKFGTVKSIFTGIPPRQIEAPIRNIITISQNNSYYYQQCIKKFPKNQNPLVQKKMDKVVAHILRENYMQMCAGGTIPDMQRWVSVILARSALHLDVESQTAQDWLRSPQFDALVRRASQGISLKQQCFVSNDQNEDEQYFQGKQLTKSENLHLFAIWLANGSLPADDVKRFSEVCYRDEMSPAKRKTLAIKFAKRLQQRDPTKLNRHRVDRILRVAANIIPQTEYDPYNLDNFGIVTHLAEQGQIELKKGKCRGFGCGNKKIGKSLKIPKHLYE